MRIVLCFTAFVLGWIFSYAFQIRTIKELNSKILSLNGEVKSPDKVFPIIVSNRVRNPEEIEKLVKQKIHEFYEYEGCHDWNQQTKH
jgi:uncharacterized UPF0146 family protein